MPGGTPVELGRALVADLQRRRRRIERLGKHQFPCVMQSQMLLELQRAHWRHGTEVVVQRGDAHIGDLGQFFHAKRFGVVFLQP